MRDFLPISRYISQTIQAIAIVAMEGEYETTPKLLDGTSFNNLERLLNHFSRSRYYSTSNNSQMVQDMSYSYNGGLIESHTWSIEPRLFQ